MTKESATTKKKEKNKNSILTEKDILILRKLLEDGRRSSSSISKEIDLGREIVNYRIKRLIKENLIIKFIPKINEEAINYKEYIILLKLNLKDELSKEKFIREQIGNKYLIWIIKSNEGWDLIVRLYAENIEEFKKKLNEILENYSEILANYYTIIASDEIKESEKEIISKKIFNEKNYKTKDFKIIKQKKQVELDEKNKKILEMLETDARIQYKEIAKRLNISSDTVKYRIDKMKEEGVIENFLPVINLNKLGYLQYASILKFMYLTTEEEQIISKFLQENRSVVRAIKNINAEEYFITLVFNSEEEKENFKKSITELLKKKIQNIEIFKIE